jgi:hypothetical protein
MYLVFEYNGSDIYSVQVDSGWILGKVKELAVAEDCEVHEINLRFAE